ncbi:dihydromonapterin reductase [Shewanella colwelliana]|uniref:Dihydromonapterin reductase n=1 Tax=Shewanella colwelliana TaxID=23 RepID=A0A1E5ITZ8_SHECO|nr:dihydromonapterin reductase [Shewanella colwelliana]MCZ4338396.1 dihydromonapterin reductase [Shewanella colwelliana]MDX1281378.1 dihydromonapterin reductase [Shewanella colwelliana]OEG74015.1 dihydromonapterin reductase [Shewanella colwelliana]GIU17248.1 dihydromonapterin reductase [Shewanella colwelliana]GIU39251.1 dihydromonapterin reductase [Shewanella colwelliana]
MQPTILITGVGKRIGLYLANDFIARGYHVIGTFRSHYASIDTLSEAGADLYCCDFNQADEVDTFIDAIASKYRQLDAIIHNASQWLPDNSPLAASDVMEQMMRVHVTAPYQINLGLEKLLTTGERLTDIIHLTDYVATKGSKKHIAYAASKAALENMTLSFATKLAPKVKVNSIAPALICFNDHDDEDYKQQALAKSLLEREAGEIEVLNAVNYLLGSHYVTGRSLALDGGRHLK